MCYKEFWEIFSILIKRYALSSPSCILSDLNVDVMPSGTAAILQPESNMHEDKGNTLKMWSLKTNENKFVIMEQLKRYQ